MLQFIFFIISLLASSIGAICGVGGGVIVKPALDAIGVMPVSSINFLSGCTVLAMACVSVIKSRSSRELLEVKTTLPLTIGAIFGGLIGKLILGYLGELLKNENGIGAVQAMVLLCILIVVILYTVFDDKIHTLKIKSIAACFGIGLFLGAISSFLSIGGGPFNLALLCFFFSMDMKKAAANSLFIILFSQLSSLVQTLITKSVPDVGMDFLVVMIVAGILGGFIGGYFYKKMNAKAISRLFIAFVIVIVFIDIFNIYKFVSLL